jgi:ribonuclease HII
MHGEFESIVGIDEAGRGPLAGPVAVGAVLLYPDFDMKIAGEIKNKDSKKLSPEKRQEWFIKIQNWQKEGKLLFHVELVSHTIIDTKGISFAIKKGIKNVWTESMPYQKFTHLARRIIESPKRISISKDYYKR